MHAGKSPGGLTSAKPLPRSFFQRATVDVARDLLGTILVREQGERPPLSGWITETEAYVGSEDLASHGRHGRTERNQSMWGPAGHAYVYFTYGMHWMLNVVTEEVGFPSAVLIRGLLPRSGHRAIGARRAGRPEREWTDGPAKLCQALAIDGEQDGLDLCQPGAPLRIHAGIPVPEGAVTRGPRVGLNRVPEPWLSKPWRLRVEQQRMRQLIQREGD